MTTSALFLNQTSFSAEFPTFRKFFVSLHDHFIPHARNNYHPHILSHRMLGLLSLLLMTVKIASIALIAMGPAATVQSSAITNETVVSLANEARVANGLGELTVNAVLNRAANAKAQDMLAKQYFAHNTPDGKTPWDFIKAAGYQYITAGENLAIDFTEAESIQTAWMNSPGHRANILNKNFKEIGIGIASGVFDNHQTTIVVQMFGTPISQNVTLKPAPTPVAKPGPAPAPVAPTPAPAPAPTTTTAPAQHVTTSEAPKPAEQPVTATPPLPAQPQLDILETKTALQGSDLYISVKTSGLAVKLLAIYGNKSTMLDPAEDNMWHGSIPLADIGAQDNLVVQAYDINGNIHQTPIAQFSDHLGANGNVEGASVTMLGKTFIPKVMEQKFFLMIMAALITCLVVAIAVKRHVQHVSLIANTSFVAMLAAILLMV